MGVAKAALETVRYLAHDLGPKGIRINAISAGPLRTLAAAGISDFKSMLHHVAERAPLKRDVEAEEVGKTALYLCSDLGSAVTGEVLHVDAGYNIMGMSRLGKWSDGVVGCWSDLPNTPSFQYSNSSEVYMAIKEGTPQQAHEILTNDTSVVFIDIVTSRVRQWSSRGRSEYSCGVPRPVARYDDERGLRQGSRSKLSSRQEDYRRLQAGLRSNAAAGLLQQAGYQDVSNMLRGIRRHA